LRSGKVGARQPLGPQGCDHHPHCLSQFAPSATPPWDVDKAANAYGVPACKPCYLPTCEHPAAVTPLNHTTPASSHACAISVVSVRVQREGEAKKLHPAFPNSLIRVMPSRPAWADATVPVSAFRCGERASRSVCRIDAMEAGWPKNRVAPFSL
jgi:hypothetical protein